MGINSTGFFNFSPRKNQSPISSTCKKMVDTVLIKTNPVTDLLIRDRVYKFVYDEINFETMNYDKRKNVKYRST